MNACKQPQTTIATNTMTTGELRIEECKASAMNVAETLSSDRGEAGDDVDVVVAVVASRIVARVAIAATAAATAAQHYSHRLHLKRDDADNVRDEHDGACDADESNLGTFNQHDESRSGLRAATNHTRPIRLPTKSDNELEHNRKQQQHQQQQPKHILTDLTQGTKSQAYRSDIASANTQPPERNISKPIKTLAAATALAGALLPVSGAQMTQPQAVHLEPAAAAAAAAGSYMQSHISNTIQQHAAEYTTTPKALSALYDNMPSSMQYVLYDFWEMNKNPELNKYALFNGGPWLLCLFVGSYLYFVKRYGPKMMENKQPYDLKPLIRLYNFGMVLFNAYLFYHASPFLNFGFHCWGCSNALKPMVNESIPVVWLVLISRFFDFFDTVFFVLRKKFSHVSFLHVFHHTVVPIGFWIGIKFAFYPVCCFIPYLNLVVHVIMYSYYGLSTFGPRVQKYLWWKKYLTRLQIAQFLIALVHSLQPLYLHQCTFPTIFVMGQTAGAVLFLWLFVSFYINAYTKQRNSTSTAPEVSKLDVPAKHQVSVDGKQKSS